MLWAAGDDWLLQPDSFLCSDHSGFQLSPRIHHGYVRSTADSAKPCSADPFFRELEVTAKIEKL